MAAADESVDTQLDGTRTAASAGEGRTDDELELRGVSAIAVFVYVPEYPLIMWDKVLQSRRSHRASFRWHGL